MKIVQKHGYSQHRHYPKWKDLNNRCYNKNNKDYENYGARGITVCSKWRRNNGPQAFCAWADSTYIEGYLLDRKDNSLGYSPDNCRWVPITVSNLNRRRHKKKSSLPVGVYTSGYKFRVMLCRNDKQIYLGHYASVVEAEAAYNAAIEGWTTRVAPTQDYQ